MDLGELVAVAIIGAVITILLQNVLFPLLLPDEFRYRVTRFNKRFWKQLSNRSYDVGVASRLDFKDDTLALEEVKKKLEHMFGAYSPSLTVHELYFKLPQRDYDVNVKIQPNYDLLEAQDAVGSDSADKEEVNSLTVTVGSKPKYKDVRNQIEDVLTAQLNHVETPLAQHFDLSVASRALYVENLKLGGFPGLLHDSNVTQVTGKLEGSNSEFVFYNETVRLEKIDSVAVRWLLDVITLMG
jgi:hypothetical protein